MDLDRCADEPEGRCHAGQRPERSKTLRRLDLQLQKALVHRAGTLIIGDGGIEQREGWLYRQRRTRFQREPLRVGKAIVVEQLHQRPTDDGDIEGASKAEPSYPFHHQRDHDSQQRDLSDVEEGQKGSS